MMVVFIVTILLLPLRNYPANNMYLQEKNVSVRMAKPAFGTITNTNIVYKFSNPFNNRWSLLSHQIAL